MEIFAKLSDNEPRIDSWGIFMVARQQKANAVRFLSIDAVQKANSGHPGMPMGMADIAEVLWSDYLIHNPCNPYWVNRDRFILSNGHGSMLLYSLLHLTGYDVSLDDLKNFRQLHSRTPGHPEFGCAPGVETTTGPLGQGLANAVGMALAERTLAAQFNRPGFDIVDHMTYVFAGDGCLMEGISHEVCSLAGTLGLGKLIAFYDDNGISIDGKVIDWFRDDTPKRFEAYHWHVIPDVDGHDPEAIKQAIEQARQVNDKPSLICCKTIIGYGAPNLAGSHHTHGAPLGDEEVLATREKLAWPYCAFEIPQEIKNSWDSKEQGLAAEEQWNTLFDGYTKEHPQLADEFIRRQLGDLPESWPALSNDYIEQCAKAKPEKIATRKASLKTLNALAPSLPELFGGSADLSDSNLTKWSDCKTIINCDQNGNYIFYGVREFGMSAIMNGIALHGGFIPYGGTFLVFSDYARNAVRLSALMKAHVIYVYTHDSIGLGEDGPTHQPVEHLTMLRETPDMSVWRPCDSVETAVAWQQALEHKEGPTSLILSRQSLEAQPRSEQQIKDIAKGAYIIKDCQQEPEAIIIATGSEVELAIAAWRNLSDAGKQIRVISMPSVNVFLQQDAAYQAAILPDNIRRRVAVEAGASAFWYQFVGLDGKVVGIDRFGESAPGAQVYQALGMTQQHIIDAVNEVLTGEYV